MAKVNQKISRYFYSFTMIHNLSSRGEAVAIQIADKLV